jgi:hypothetical protein
LSQSRRPLHFSKVFKGLITNKPLILVLMVAGLLATSSRAADERQTLGGHVPEAVAGLQPVGRLDGSQRLKLAIGLGSRDKPGLDRFIQDLYDPASPNYRHYLTPGQFTKRFGPTQKDYQAVMDYAKSSHLNVTRQYSNRVVLDVEGAVTDIEKALHLTLRTYLHPSGTRTFYGPDAEPSFALGVPIQHIGGLDNYTPPHPKHTHRSINRNATPKGSAPDGVSLWGNDFRDAYVPGTSLTGTGQNLGLLEFEGYYSEDITDYENAIGMSPNNRPQLVIVPLDGGATPGDGGDNGEECSIDIEMAVAMAPGLSSIYIFENGSTNSGNGPFDDIFESMVTYTNILQFSCSWGGNTLQDPTSEVLFKQMAAQGQSFYNASGDMGAFVGPVAFPSDSPSITQVGGTTLTDGSGPSYPWENEVVWDPESGPHVSLDSAESSSGGISTYYAIPSWQTNVSMKASQGSTTMRNTPDVAANADNCYIYSDNGEASGGWGGTSCAAPLWAALTALINQQAVAGALPPEGFLNPALYALASGANYTAFFHDVTSGNNTWAQSPNRFYAAAGYDLCCGLGTMNGTNLIDALVAPTLSLSADGYTLTTNEPCTNGAVNPGERVAVNLVLTNGSKVATTNLVATLLTSNGVVFPSGPQTIGALAAGTSATNTFSFFADGSCGETIIAVLQLQDGSANLGTVSYNFQLGVPFSTTNFAQSFDAYASLPSGWTTSASKGLTSWAIESSTNDGTTKVAYCPDAATPGEVYLYSPTILLGAGTNQLSFLNDFNLEGSYDGGVLEIAIGNSAIASANFSDIVTAGGSFVPRGYNGTISDAGDSSSEDDPLINRQAWTGNSEGYVTTVVSLPAPASGANIQLRWICGTDDGNEGLDGIGGWWIDDVVISQPGFNCSDCGTNVFAPIIFFPTNNYQLTTISPVVRVTGQAPDGSAVTIFTNGIADLTVAADGYGVFTAATTLNFGTDTLSVMSGTNTSSNVTVYIALGPPILELPPVVNTNVTIRGLGAPGATVSLYEGVSTNGPRLTNVIVDSSGSFSVAVPLSLGNVTLTATEAISGQTSTNTTPISVSVVPLPPPVLISPVNGLIVNKVSTIIAGKGVAGATVTISNVTGNVTNFLAKATVNSAGRFSASGVLVDGLNTLYAVQEKNGTISPVSAPVVVTVYLRPVIAVQPENQTNFLKGTVTFAAVAYGAAPLSLFWETNGVKLRGANSSKLTLSNLKSSETNYNYRLVASNKYGVVFSSAVTLTLVTNPFTNLAGAYYGLFAESNAQFESSGLLTLNLTSSGKFTARILSAGSSYSFADALSGVGWCSNSVARGTGETPLSVLLDLNVTNGAEQILGAVSAGTNWSADLEADRATYNGANPCPDQGKFTLLFANTNNGAQSPGGDGYGTVNVSLTGMISLSGVLSDDTSVAPSAVSVSKYGWWPLYIPLYGKFGSLAGWVNFTNQGASVVDLTNSGVCSFVGSNVTWFRTNAGGKLYSSGFTNSLTVLGSAFRPANNTLLLDSPNLEIILSGGNLAETLSNGVSLAPSGKFTAEGSEIPGLILNLNPASGVIRGSFDDPAASGATPIKGVVFQDQTNAGGFFRGTTNSGSFLLTPP